MNSFHQQPDWILEDLPYAFAYHKIITNTHGNPVDYLFLHVNQTFEKITGLSKEETIGKRVTQVLPEIRESRFDWIKTYGRVALKGESIYFEEHSEALQGWYQIHAYSKEKGYFSTIFRNITHRKEAQEKRLQQERLQKLLLKLAADFINIPLPKIDRTLHKMMQAIGEFTEVDRISIFTDHQTESTTSRTHEWRADGITPEVEKDIPLSFFSPLLEDYSSKEVAHIPSVEKISKNLEISSLFTEQGTQSLLLLPLFCEGMRTGWVEFDSVQRVRVFTEMEIAHLKTFVEIISNILARQKAEEVLLASEEKYRTIVENTNEALYIHDFQGNMIDVNQNACQVMGYTREQLLQLTLKDLNSEEVNSKMPGLIEKLLHQGQIQFEGAFIGKDGRVVPGDVSAKVVSWEGNGIIQSFARDITQRKNIEEKVRKSEKDLSLTLESIHDGVITTDQKGRITKINPVAQDLTGWKMEEALHREFHEVFHLSYDRKKDFNSFSIQEVIQANQVIPLPKNTTLTANNHSSYQISGSASPISDEEGNTIGVVVTFSNISNQHRLQQELEEKERLNHLILSSLPHPVMLIRGKDKVILSANQTAIDMGAKIGGYCWREFGQAQYLSPKDRERIQGIPEGDPIPPQWNIHCVFCQGDECLHQSLDKNNPELKMFDRVWDVYWIKVHEDTYLHYAIDMTQVKQAEMHLKEYANKLEEVNLRLDEEILKAKQVHEKTLPKILPKIEGLDIYAHYMPAAQIGGDFYNFFQLGDEFLFYVSDVTGHGLDAAIMSAFVKNTISTYVTLKPEQTPFDPAALLYFILNQFIQEEFPEEFFIAILFGTINTRTHTLTYSSAGIQVPPLLFYRGEMNELPAGNLPISTTIPETLYCYSNEQFHIPPGATLLFSTDGLAEQRVNNRMYGEIYPSNVQNKSFLPPGALAEVINEGFTSFTGEITGNDDITYFILQRPTQNEYPEQDLEIESSLEAVQDAKKKIQSFLSAYQKDTDHMMMALHEMLINAVEHGNSFLKEKRVQVHIEIRERFFLVSVEDEGEGFDWRKQAFLTENAEFLQEKVAVRGRGLGYAITKTAADYFYYYNETGNKATFVVLRETE